MPIPIVQRRCQDLAVQFLNRRAGAAFPRRDILEQAAEGVRGPDREERVRHHCRRRRGAVAVAVGPDAGHGRDISGQEVAEGLRCGERGVGADDEPG